MNRITAISIVIASLAIAGLFVVYSGDDQRPIPRFVMPEPAQAADPVLLPIAANILDVLGGNPFGLIEPVAQFSERITKKRFGMFITPATSPVANDRFTGYHTGVDIEFTDAGVDIPVVAIADGTVTASTRMNGYGGVVVVRHVIAGTTIHALYGHLDPASMIPAGSTIRANDRLGILGDDHSEETDGVRKHLHLAFYAGTTMDYRGYVPQPEDLTAWLDPLDYLR